jgi:DNA-binding CsgD family transcriptional regulator
VHGWVEALADGTGRAALVEGEPGIGKSSLLRAAASAAEAAGCHVLWASCDELSQAFPLLPLLDALDVSRHAAVTGREKIIELLRTDFAPGNRVDVVAAATEQFLCLMDELCAAAPVLLVVDDLQWADPATVLALGRLARAVRGERLLVLGASRPVPRREDIIALRRLAEPDGLIRLHSLTDVEAAQLVEQAVGGTPGARLLELAEGAAGNPLYLTELVDALMRSRALTAGDGYVEAVGQPPESLAAAIADRLEFLSLAVRDVLRAAALLGEEFSVVELAPVCGRRVGDLLPVLDEAILAGVLLDNGSGLAFRHPLIRAALYDAMPATLRAAWHRDAARALAEDAARAEWVARQLLPAVEAYDGSGPVDEWMVHWLADTGSQLVGQAPHVAIPLLRWAVSGVPAGVAPHDVLASRLADALYWVGDVTGAAQVAEAALVDATRTERLVDLHWTLTVCRTMNGRYEEALIDLGRALKTPGIEPRDRARLLVMTARTYRSMGRLEVADEVAETALAEATAAVDRWATAWALGILAIVRGMQGAVIDALPLLGRALAAAEADPTLVDLRLLLQLNQAAGLGDLDQYDTAISAAEQARQLAEGAGNAVRQSQAQEVLAELLYDVGRWDDALAEFGIGSDGSGDPSVECCANGFAATICFHRSDGAAIRHLAEADRFAARLGGRVPGSLALARSLEREHAGAPGEALAALMDGLSHGAEEVEQTTELLADAVRLAVAVGDGAAARTVVARAEAVAEESDVPHRLAIGPHCRGLLDRDPAQLLRAASHYLTAGRPLPRAQALEAAAVLLADDGDVPGARTHFTDAFSLYERLGAGWDLARTQALFRRYGIRRGPHNRHRRSDRGWESLTPTELKVVDLVAQGMSNPGIAAHLFLSRRTVQTHVSHILAKLDLHSRIDIAREASLRDLSELTEADRALAVTH